MTEPVVGMTLVCMGGRYRGLAAGQRSRIMNRDGHACRYCGHSFVKAKRYQRKLYLTVDHVIPLSRGGDATDGNLVAACKRCNGEKAERTPLEWRQGLARRFAKGPPKTLEEITRIKESCHDVHT